MILGIIGGGQLARMMCYSAALLGIDTIVFTDTEDCPASKFANKLIVGSYTDSKAMQAFCEMCDFITPEFENLDTSTLSKHYSWIKAIEVSQDRLKEKEFFRTLDINTPIFSQINTHKDLVSFYQEHGTCVLKTVRGGYDGLGQFVVNSLENLPDLAGNTYIAEKFVPFVKEVSVICTRSQDGDVVFYPIPTNIHRNGILDISNISYTENHDLQEELYSNTSKIVQELDFVGTMCVEYFVLQNGDILANEMAPRPHNSGHFTIDLCSTSQFENHVRAVCGMPLLEPYLLKSGIMKNIIGKNMNELLAKNIDNSNARIHLYGKKEARDGRKMGHITFIDCTNI